MRQLLRTDRPRGPTEAHVAVRPKAAGDACSLFAAENTRNVRDLAQAPWQCLQHVPSPPVPSAAPRLNRLDDL